MRVGVGLGLAFPAFCGAAGMESSERLFAKSTNAKLLVEQALQIFFSAPLDRGGKQW